MTGNCFEKIGRCLCMCGCPGRAFFGFIMGIIMFLWSLIVLCLVLPSAILAAIVYSVVSCTCGCSGGQPDESIAASEDAQLKQLGCMLKYRAQFVIAFVLPLSLIYDVAYAMRSTYIQASCAGFPELHQARVQQIQAQVKHWASLGCVKRIVTARPGWLSISPSMRDYKSKSYQVSVPLYDVLEVDEEACTVRVEPQVTMGQLTSTLLPRGWTIPCVPEMDDLTCGGLICGCGIEATSHRYGLFQAICLQFELVTCDGEVTTCSAEHNADLFRAVPWSYGTLGLLTAATIRIIRAKPYLRLQYRPYWDDKNNSAFSAAFIEATQQGSAADAPSNEFVEGLVYSEKEAVLMVADFIDKPLPDETINHIGRFWKPWFYEHVRSIGQDTACSEVIPLRDYYHRHTKAIFWELNDIVPGGNHCLFRYTLGWMVPPKVSFLKLTQTETIRRLYEEQHVIQDMLVPLSTLGPSLACFREHYRGLYPLWVCPFRLERVPGFVHPPEDLKSEELYVDLGAYGIPDAARVGQFNACGAGRAVEQFVRDQHGFQMLYADTYMTKEELRQMFDHSLYDKLRTSEVQAAFPDVYEKVGRYHGAAKPPTQSGAAESSKVDEGTRLL